MAQLTVMNHFSQVLNFALTRTALNAPLVERLTIAENQHYTLPATVTSIRVLSGKAWISYQGKDVVVKTGATMEFEMGRGTAVVTSLGYKPVKLEVIQ